MNLKMVIAGITLVFAQATFAGLSYEVDARIDRILNGEESFVAMNTAAVTTTGDVTAGNDLSVAGDADVTGSLTVTGSGTINALLSLTPHTLSVTNGQVITPLYSSYVLQPGAAHTTNTIATGYATGDIVMFTVGATNAGSVTFADSTTVLALGADVALSATDTLLVYFTGTNTAVKIGGNDN